MWLRRDLRLTDHPALAAALNGGGPDRRIVPLFVLDPALLRSRRMSPARLSYLCDALADLDQSLRGRDGRLVLREGDPTTVVPAVAAEVKATQVHLSGDVSPYAQRRDAQVSRKLAAQNVAVQPHNSTFVQPPGRVCSGSGEMYRVFSPFARAWARLPVGTALPAPDRIPVHGSLRSERLPTLRSLGVALDAGVICGGEAQAQQRLDAFLDEWSGSYHEARNRLGEPATSRLSADLHYGCVSPRTILARLDRRKPGHKAFATELAWRDFYAHVLHAWPEVRTSEFNPALRTLPWRGEGEAFTAWTQGRTGYPVVDAGMRQLLAEGWMHNRARMITASFLCKDLLIDWRLGETHFLRHLVDGDLASNNGGWQWAAGTGTDAQPYFRIFNPVLQGQKFDRDGAYVRRYVPELRRVQGKWLHSPWEMPEEVQREVGVRIGRDYPAPIVDHAEARQRALDWFDQHTQHPTPSLHEDSQRPTASLHEDSRS